MAKPMRKLLKSKTEILRHMARPYKKPVKKTTARVIITLKCKRKCSYCTNNYKSIIGQANHTPNTNLVTGYEEICITGGEPMLSPVRTYNIINELRKANPNAKIYMYTAWFYFGLESHMERILKLVDGVQFTIHGNSKYEDVNDFETFQFFLFNWLKENKKPMSFRLSINSAVKFPVRLIPTAWTAVKFKNRWLDETTCIVPKHEDLFILEEDYNA